MEIKLWIGNLGKYNEGELVGEWFTLPVDMEEVAEIIGLNEEYEEYHICDWEAPAGIKIDRYSNIDTLNEIAERIESLDQWDQETLEMILDTGAYDFEDSLNIVENSAFTIHHDCKSMSDVAYNYYEETGMMRDIPEHLQNYIDWDAMGRDMEINGNFYEVDSNTYIEINN